MNRKINNRTDLKVIRMIEFVEKDIETIINTIYMLKRKS